MHYMNSIQGLTLSGLVARLKIKSSLSLVAQIFIIQTFSIAGIYLEKYPTFLKPTLL